METTIIKIGNSQGLIIPKKILKSLGTNTRFEMQLKDGGLFIEPLFENKSRHNWEKQFTDAIQNGYNPDNEENDFSNDFDENEWTW